jgi:predicted ribosome quality control (RQC) complex YloA/Tae2 family protein
MALLCRNAAQGFCFRNTANKEMHHETLKEVVTEIDKLLAGRFLRRIFQLTPESLAIDFNLRHDGFLLISVEPAAPRLYLTKRSVRELERQTLSPSPFVLALRTALGEAALSSVTKDEAERIVRFNFSAPPDGIDQRITTMLVQLTGRSANLFLLDGEETIVHALRRPMGEGQRINDKYKPPRQSRTGVSQGPIIGRGSFPTMSEAVAEFYRGIEAEAEFKNAASQLKDQLRREIAKRERLLTNLKNDLAGHGNADEHKRLGDLLLANIGNAKRTGDLLTLTDYYAEGQPSLEMTLDENKLLQDAAAEAFSRYGKAKRAVVEIGERLAQVDKEVEELKQKQARLDKAIAGGDESILASFAASKPKTARAKSKESKTIPGTRRYRSSDGYEVIVGRTARDNDNLTFRVARPNDLWLHAGDYPGSHVIVSNTSRREIPQRTVIEAAQLAAKFSQASNDSKVIIHYTRRKFLSKPKGSAPGLVRMSNFKTIAVEPAENIERII